MTIHWCDIVNLNSAQDAAHAIDVATTNVSTRAEAAELIGAAVVRQIPCESDGWTSSVTSGIGRWREVVAWHAMLRWRLAFRERLVWDVLEEAADCLEHAARRAGVELPRSPIDTLLDAACDARLRRSRT